MDLGSKYVCFEERFDFVIEEAMEDLQDEQPLVLDLEILASTIANKDTNTCLRAGTQERFRVWDVTLKNMWAMLQILPPGLLT